MEKLIAITLLAGLAGVSAAVPDRDWPSVEVTPILDVPLRDTAITRGPDGMYYLTGTLGGATQGTLRDRNDGHRVAGVASEPSQSAFTERGPWPWMKPLLPAEHLRDMKPIAAPDGFYYVSGSLMSRPGELCVFRSEDLAKWERIGPLWTYGQIEWLDHKEPFPKNPPGGVDWHHIFWHTMATYWKDTYYITYCIFSDLRGGDPNMRGTAALKSTSGKIEGPYVSLGKVGGQVGADPGPVLCCFFEYQDKLYARDVKDYKPVVGEADLDAPGWKFDWKRVDAGVFGQYSSKDGFGVMGFDDKILFTNLGSGRVDNRERSNNTGYCVNYMVADTPWGPARGVMRMLPHCGACCQFHDRKGYWWSVYFGSDHQAPWWESFGLVPLHVEDRGQFDLVMDAEEHPDDYQKRIMGGGQIAAAQTVLETLLPKEEN